MSDQQRRLIQAGFQLIILVEVLPQGIQTHVVPIVIAAVGQVAVEAPVAVVEGQAVVAFGVIALAVSGGQVAVETLLFVLFGLDVDDARVATGIVFGGGVGDQFDLIDLGGTHAAQEVGQFCPTEVSRFIVDHYQHTGFAHQTDAAIAVDHHAG